MPPRRRLDTELVRRGLAGSRTEAQDAVRSGRVLVGGRPTAKPSTLVSADEPVRLVGPPRRFVSRGGEKLDAGLDRFSVDPVGLDCLDAGASTGGFTDCLLRRGASRVVAVDVGYGQLSWTLREDPRVVAMERTNVRDLRAEDLPFRPRVTVADLSFISLGLVIPTLAGVTAEGGELILLVKPQFEAGPEAVGRGGVVRDPAVWRSVLEGVAGACRDAGVRPRAAMASPLLGPAGNVEFLLHGRLETGGSGPGAGRLPGARRGAGADPEMLEAALEEGLALRDREAS
ncbi:MAG: TlyA family RNA methyltransferase [Actinobacteria bacterium]|nr:TlyA family RNA methyltransferase [Actinomycetota bacterium]